MSLHSLVIQSFVKTEIVLILSLECNPFPESKGFDKEPFHVTCKV